MGSDAALDSMRPAGSAFEGQTLGKSAQRDAQRPTSMPRIGVHNGSDALPTAKRALQSRRPPVQPCPQSWRSS